MSSVHLFPDNRSFVHGAAAFIADVAANAIAKRGRCTMALSGGGTPEQIYACLARVDFRDRIAWEKVHILFGDERCVPPNDERSTYRMAREAWLDHSRIPADNIHRIHGEDDPEQEARRYEEQIARLFPSEELPAFDLILLGMGDDGHTASLFPGTAALRESSRWVVAQYVEQIASWRVTFTAPLINAARQVAFLVQGAAKAQILRNVLEGPRHPYLWPAQLIQPASGELHWLLDKAAATCVSTAVA